MALETTKSMRRRVREQAEGIFPWKSIFVGKMLDVGAGPDPLPFQDVTPFDIEDGDANKLSTYFPPESFDVVYGSQCLEHMIDPAEALNDWLSLVKPGGHIVQTVPCWELYEGMRWPSRTNPDHKSTWSMWQKDSPAPIHCKMPEWLHQFHCWVRRCELIDTNYNYRVGVSRDQTWELSEGVECWIEFVLHKPFPNSGPGYIA